MDSPGTLLIVDDDVSVRRLLRRCFEGEGYVVHEAADGAETLAALEANGIDLITLDLNLGGEDGLNVARRVRAISDVAIIMVSAKGELIDRVVGLEVGADDYVAKPFELREVLARVRSVLRRTGAERAGPPLASARVEAEGAPSAESDEAGHAASGSRGTEPLDGPSDELYRFGGCTLDVPAREFRGADGTPLELTTGEFELLHLFLRSGRQVLSRNRIMDALKGADWHPNDRTIDNHVARLRRKLDAGGAERPIRTVRGVGYQFVLGIARERGTGAA